MNIADTSAAINANMVALLADAKVDVIDTSQDSVTLNVLADDVTTKLLNGDTVTVVDDSATINSELATIVGDAKIDYIDANEALAYTATAAATVGLGAKTTAADVITITGITYGGGQTIEDGVFQTGNDKLSSTSAGFSSDVNIIGADSAITFVTLADATKVELVVSTGVGLIASNAEAAFLFDTATGALTFDADGINDVATVTDVITLTGVVSVEAGDFDFV